MTFGAVCPNGGLCEHLASGYTVQRKFPRVRSGDQPFIPGMAFPEPFCARLGLEAFSSDRPREHQVLMSHRAANRSNKRCILAGEGCRHNQRPRFSP